jgi:rhodanese-related sulfurtransferase
MYDGRRLDLGPATEAPRDLAPLINPTERSGGTVPPHGEEVLRHPEPGLYLVGMKSYGRAPTFLLPTGYEQVRSVVEHLAASPEEAGQTDLELIETESPHAETTRDEPVPTIDREGVRRLIENEADVALVEAMPRSSYHEEHLPGARHLPPDAVRERAPDVLPSRNQTVIVYCAGPECGLSGGTARVLTQMGYLDVREYPGGKSDWREAGYWFETGLPGVADVG